MLFFSVSSDTPKATPQAHSDSAQKLRLRNLVESESTFVWKQLRSLGLSETAAEDVMQLVFLKASELLSNTPKGEERSLLYGILRRMAANERRKQSLRHSYEIDDPDDVLKNKVESHSASLEGNPDLQKARIWLDRILATFPEEQREVFSLFEFEDLSLDEIAVYLEIPRGTAASRLRLARERFHKEVSTLRSELASDLNINAFDASSGGAL